MSLTQTLFLISDAYITTERSTARFV